MSTSTDKIRLLKLLKEKAFFKQPVTLSSGKRSDYYIDARRVTLTAEGAFLCGRILFDLLLKEKFDSVGGPTLGADPLLGALAAMSFREKRPIATFIIRKTPKPHGRQLQIEGPCPKEGSTAVLIDDVATTGKALLEGMDVLSRLQVKVERAICLIDREEGAQEALAERGCVLISVLTIKDFLPIRKLHK